MTDCATAQARAPLNSRIIYGDQTPFPGQARGRWGDARDCRYERVDSRPSLGEIIFGRRAGDYDCRYDTRRQTGAWYEVGRDVYGNRIYQRTVRTRDGEVLLQRARRDRYGRMVVVDTRHADSRVLRGGLTDDEVWARSRGRGSDRWDGDDDDRRWAQANRGNGNGRGKVKRGRGNGRRNGR